MSDAYSSGTFEPLPNVVEPEDRRSTGWRGWAVSVSLHALLLLSMYSIYWVVKEPDTETPPVRIATIEPPKQSEEKPKLERVLETQVELQVEAEADKPSPVSALDLPVETTNHEEEADQPVAKGREEAVADSEMGGSGAFMAIGGGGGSAGMFGSRSGGGKKRALGRYGGSRGSESAVDAALRWFKKHQSPNGMWDHVVYVKNCSEDPKCEPGQDPSVDTDIAMTGYAVLCYLGAGYDHMTPNKYKAVVKKGIDYLVAAQNATGVLGTKNYENAIATMALAEAYAMTGDPALKQPAQTGVNVILARQNQVGGAAANPSKKTDGYGTGLGWDYIGPNTRNDSSVTGWNVMALKSAMAAQLTIGNGMEGAKNWLDRTWKAMNPNWATLDPYQGISDFPYSYDDTTKKIDAPGRACLGEVCAVFLGHHAGDAMLESLANYVMANNLPTRYPCNAYYLYYNTLGIFQVGGERWKKWNQIVRELLIGAQRRGQGCFDGSWDASDETPGGKNGRVFTTALCCLSLEVYYRYAQVAGHPDAQKRVPGP